MLSKLTIACFNRLNIIKYRPMTEKKYSHVLLHAHQAVKDPDGSYRPSKYKDGTYSGEVRVAATAVLLEESHQVDESAKVITTVYLSDIGLNQAALYWNEVCKLIGEETAACFTPHELLTDIVNTIDEIVQTRVLLGGEIKRLLLLSDAAHCIRIRGFAEFFLGKSDDDYLENCRNIYAAGRKIGAFATYQEFAAAWHSWEPLAYDVVAADDVFYQYPDNPTSKQFIAERRSQQIDNHILKLMSGELRGKYAWKQTEYYKK